ncbi:protein lin-37 homolog [Amyelois transitella]|uniref:protein lin-37 homolog n=1 Tax=Amyelois transitella TaxID=680683 RepID=UPI00298F5E34|nr:protein lin-37 homolog [Amyelois transitella]
MPKRRRLLTPMKKKSNVLKTENDDKDEANVPETPEKEVSTARGRLKGALLEALEPVAGEDSDTSYEPTSSKKNRRSNHDSKWDDDSEEETPRRRRSPVRQSYVLKLFDRSVDLSQFEEDSPLYPICRAWIANQPKADYSKFGVIKKETESSEGSIDLPGPEGPHVSPIPDLIPEQKEVNVDKINLNYDGPLPSREELLECHARRWSAVRRAWAARAARLEARYHRTQRVLNTINVNTLA